MDYIDKLQKYIPVADAIAQTFGEYCEVVIHNLKSPRSSVIYTRNDHVTGRKIGQSFDHLITQVLLSRKFSNDVVANYRTKTVDNRTIKSTTVLLRDDLNEVIGALCINYDIEVFMNMDTFLKSFTKMDNEPVVKNEKVEVVSNVWDIVDNLIDETIPLNSPSTMRRNEKIEVIQFLNEKGIFLIKGALEKVANRLGVSNPTLYSYLDEIRSQNKEVL